MNHLRLCLGLFLASAAFAAQSATSFPMGGLAVKINAGTIAAPVSTSFAIPLYDPPLAIGAGVGRIASLTATTITCIGAGWTSGALSTPAFPYAFRITSGGATGATFYVTGNTADTLTTSGVDLSTQGLLTGASGDTFRLIPVDTLNTLFGSNTLLGGTSPTDADIVYISSSSQLAYYYNGSLSRWVRTTGPTTDRGNTPIPLDSALLVTRKSTALTLRFTGRVPDVRFNLSVPNAGTTYTHAGFPTEVTLGALSLQTALPGWVSGATAASADTLTVGLAADGLSYFFNGTNWQRTTGPATNRDAIVISAGTPILIFKRGVAPGTSSFTRALPYAL
jgi:uncharacterized protein (TIGR02597 family)